MKESQSYDTFTGQCTPYSNAWLILLRCDCQMKILICPILIVIPVHVTRQLGQSPIWPNGLIKMVCFVWESATCHLTITINGLGYSPKDPMIVVDSTASILIYILSITRTFSEWIIPEMDIVWTVHKCQNDSHLIFFNHRSLRTSRFQCINPWTCCFKFISSTINCQSCWRNSIKCILPCCVYLAFSVFLYCFRILFLCSNDLLLLAQPIKIRSIWN